MKRQRLPKSKTVSLVTVLLLFVAAFPAHAGKGNNGLVQSPVFSVTTPANNIHGADAGTYWRCVDEGYYILLAPLSKGEHTIHFTSSHPFFGAVLDITYQIT